MHCVNSSNHFLLPLLSHILFVGFPDKFLAKVLIIDLSLGIGSVVGKKSCERCSRSSLFVTQASMPFLEVIYCSTSKENADGLGSRILCSDAKLKQSPAGITSSNRNEILVSLHLVVIILEFNFVPV